MSLFTELIKRFLWDCLSYSEGKDGTLLLFRNNFATAKQKVEAKEEIVVE